MTHRERVLMALQHNEPDRVPRDLMGNATMLLDSCYFLLRDYLKLSPIPPVREGSTANYYDERILEYFDIDFRRIFLKPNPEMNCVYYTSEDTFKDVWSIQYRKNGLFVTAIDSPLKGITSVNQVEEYPWPDGKLLFLTEGLREKALSLQNAGYAVVARNPFSAGFIDRAGQLMGVENFLISLISDPDIANRVLKNIFKVYYNVYYSFLKEVGPFVDIVETADDIGTQNSLLISPELYREFIKPLEKDFYNMIHEQAPSAALFRHTDGAVFSLIDDFIEVGINILNPVQTSTNGMEGRGLKAAYGNRITFHGAIEQLNHNKETIGQEVQEKLDIFKPGGGYIFAPCNHIIDASPETILAMFEACEKFGAY